MFAIDLDDRAVSLARNGRVLSSAPSAVFDPSGADAWRELRLQPRSTSSRHLTAVLAQRNATARSEALVEAELRARLAECPPTEGERVWIAAPARSEAAGLTAILGIALRIGLQVDGFVDAAVVAAATAQPQTNVIVLELGLHHAAATAVDVEGGQARRRRSVATERGGLLELYQTWLDLVGTTMVKRTRFDPLHDASTEQQLFDAIPTTLSEIAAKGETTGVALQGTQRFEVALTRDQFAQSAQSICTAIVGLLHQLRPAGAPVTIVIPRVAADLPGLKSQLEQFAGCELVTVNDGFTAAGTSLLDLPAHPAPNTTVTTNDISATNSSVRLLRRIPLQTHLPPPHAVREYTLRREPLGSHRAGSPTPSYVLWDGRAFSLNVESLTVGRSPGSSERLISLPEGLAGVSRRHCTFVHDGGQLFVLDHSSFGTFVNGERVLERARVHVGDKVRVGQPGVELSLISVGDATDVQNQHR